MCQPTQLGLISTLSITVQTDTDSTNIGTDTDTNQTYWYWYSTNILYDFLSHYHELVVVLHV